MNKFQNTFKRVFFSLQLSLLVFALATATLAAGEVDPSFNAAVQNTGSGFVHRLVVQPDGKLLIAGNFEVAGNSARTGIARLNADGTVDETFSPPDFLRKMSGGGFNSIFLVIYSIAVQSDGKIIVGGLFDRVGTSDRTGAVRLNADGSLDPSFNPPFLPAPNPTVPSPNAVYDIKIQADNKIILGGDFLLRDPQTPGIDRSRIARVNVDGSIDTSFSPPAPGIVRTVAIQADGKIVYGDLDNNVRRLNSDGTPDNSFLSSIFSNIYKVAVLPDGKILVAGAFGKGIVRLNANGSIDSTFNAGGAGTPIGIRDFSVLPDGRIVIVGGFTTYNGVPRAVIARLNADGTLDTSFNYTGGNINAARSLAVLNDGSYVLGIELSQVINNKLVRITADGTQDTNYVGDVYRRGTVNRVNAQPDGKVLIGGIFGKVNGIARSNIARLNANGSLDTTFNAGVNNIVNTVVPQADGKVLAGGIFTQANGIPRLAIARFNADGSLDGAFFTNIVNGFGQPASQITEIIPLPDGKMLIAGRFRLTEYLYELNVARLNANGSTDTSFLVQQVNIIGLVRAMKLQPDGKIVVGGNFSQIQGAARGNIARLNADGTVDTTFNPFSGANNTVFDLAIQSNGNITIGGAFSGVNGVANRYYLAQLFPDGGLNTAFNTAINNFVYAVERQSDDKILVGSFFDVNGKRGIARLNPDGSFDTSFAGSGTNDNVYDIFIQSDNKVLIGGDFTRVNGVSRVGVARLLNASAPARTPYDFDGDGRADLTVFRPSNGYWYLQQSSAGFNGLPFGASGDVIVPADYDGDGKTDLAVRRGGIWYLQQSSAGFTGVTFGEPSDVPVPADYDGDGKADIAVYRPSTGYWYLQRSTLGFTFVQFGINEDKPTLGDFDGDGKSDIAVFRPSVGTWYRINSSTGLWSSIPFGAASDLVVPADYDGDGKTDIAVYRPSNGTWYLQRSRDGFTGIAFGAAEDKPVPADYDGDGRADIAVFRPSNGYWYLLRSTQGFTGYPFGIAEDKPAPNAIVR